MAAIVRLRVDQYIHVLDNNANVIRVVQGPLTFTKQDHEEVVLGPEECINVPPMHYCVVANPVMRGADDEPVKDDHGQAKVRLGDREVRLTGAAFPLFPKEELVEYVTRLEVVPAKTALKLKCVRDFESGDGQKRVAGDMYLMAGPATYIPKVEEEILDRLTATIIARGDGWKMRAIHNFVDRTGTTRNAGEEWLYTTPGAYIPDVDEEMITRVTPHTLNNRTAIHVEAKKDFQDQFKVDRKAGEQWLVTNSQTDTYLPTPNEEVVQKLDITVLGTNQYCVVTNAYVDDKVRLGNREVRVGPITFFLRPGEGLEAGVQKVFVLSEDQAVLLTATASFEDEDGDGKKVIRRPGDCWMRVGPCTYVPTVHVSVLAERCCIPLAENEGIYVRNTSTGQVRMEVGKTYMLQADEELWEKELPEVVEKRLAQQGNAHTEYIEESRARHGRRSGRDKTRVVTYQLPHNALAQVYDYRTRSQRLIFGPDMVMLGPEEDFTIISLSGSEWVEGEPNVVRPKVADVIQALFLYLGPDQMSDVFVVETSDHARLNLQLSYGWHFDVDQGDQESAKQVFNVPDFVGDACKAIASKVRAAVARVSFDSFHKHCQQIVSEAVFGEGEGTRLVFKSNRLNITSIDIQSVECIDQKTRDSLQKSVKLAIEITTSSQEALARHEAQEREQMAKGELEQQILKDKSAAESERKELLQLQAESAAIESTGTSKAEAKAAADAKKIEGNSEVDLAQLRATAGKTMADVELLQEKENRKAELEHLRQMNKLEVKKAEDMAGIEVKKFSSAVSAIGQDTIAAMARAGPEMQAKLLKGLGLQGYLLTDGTSPINLLNTAAGLTGQAQ